MDLGAGPGEGLAAAASTVDRPEREGWASGGANAEPDRLGEGQQEERGRLLQALSLDHTCLPCGTHCRHSWGSQSHPHSQGAAGAAEVLQGALEEGNAGVRHSLALAVAPALTAGPIPFSSASLAFSSGRWGHSRSGLFLLGGLGFFWRRMYSTAGRRALSSSQPPAPAPPEAPPAGTPSLLTVLVVFPLDLVVVVQCGHLRLLLHL